MAYLIVRQKGSAVVLVLIIFASIIIVATIAIKSIKPKQDENNNQKTNEDIRTTSIPTNYPTSKPSTLTPTIAGYKPNTPSNTTDGSGTSNSNTATPYPTSTPTPRPTYTSTLFPTFTPTSSITPTVKLTYPNGGEVITEGDNITITWEATGSFSSFALGFTSCPSCFGNIAAVSGNVRSYNWKVSVGNTTNTQFKIEIVSYPLNYSGPNPIDTSDNNLTIYQNPACNSGCP